MPQERLQSASARRRGTKNAAGSYPGISPAALLLGNFRDETGDRLTPTHTRRAWTAAAVLRLQPADLGRCRSHRVALAGAAASR